MCFGNRTQRTSKPPFFGFRQVLPFLTTDEIGPVVRRQRLVPGDAGFGEFSDEGGVFGGEVLFFAAVGFQVVKLRHSAVVTTSPPSNTVGFTKRA